MTAAQRGLSVYLNDHLAGAAAGVTVLAALRSMPNVSAEAGRLLDDVTADKRELEDVIRRLGLAESSARQAAGWLTEKLAELKIRIDDPATGALHEFELLESIAIGVHGKRSLWTALRAIAGSLLPLQTVDFERLIARADEQRARIESLRLDAARRALAR